MITVLAESEQVRVRLNGIDGPERGQPFGDRAKLRGRIVGRLSAALRRGGTIAAEPFAVPPTPVDALFG